MIEGYSIMDLVTLGSIVGMIVSIAKVIRRNEKDTAMLKDKIKSLSKEHEQMKDSLEKSNHDSFESLKEKVFDQRLITTGETKRIKSDTTYIKDAMMTEKMARKNLYNHTSNAQEILDKLDFMREVINKNYELSAQNQDLINETKDLNDKIADLREQNQKKLENRKEINSKQLLGSIKRFEGQLAEFEMCGESEEIQFILKNIKNELSEYLN